MSSDDQILQNDAADTLAAVPQDSPFRSERTARDEAQQFVLPLVVRIERATPPARTDALETAAR
ncbi:peptidyl-tRNA hydrolase, partial [Streptomyces sp. A475]